MVGVPNLLLRPFEVADALRDALRSDDRMNAFLLGAGLSQIVDDYLHVSPLFSVKVAATLEASGRGRFGTVPRLVAVGAGGVRGYGPGSRRVRRWKRDVEAMVSISADLAEGSRPATAADLETLLERIHAAVPALPRALRRAVLKVPAGFQAFDLQPADLCDLIAKFAARHTDRRRPLLVVGVRTSGSYFAPLCASSLGAHGYESVEWLTVRPGFPLHPPEQRMVRSIAKRAGLVLVVDDPPGTGRSFATSAEMLCRLGVPHSSVIMLIPTFGSAAAPPPLLAGYEVVVLPHTEWAIRSQLAPERVRAALEDMQGAELEAGDVEQLALPERDGHRGHERALFRVHRRLVLAEGVGVGWFGEQALTVARGLADYVPEIHGLRDGVLYREWLPEAPRAGGSPWPARLAAITTIAQYVHERSERFAVDGDRSLAQAGRDPVWEVAASILSRAFGRAWPLARLAFMDRAAKLLLRPRRTSVVDGHTNVQEWFAAGRREHPFVKVGFADRSFWHLGLGCCDPVFDLAGTDPGASDRSFSLELRAAYEQLSGEAVDPERWLLYELAHLWGRRRTDPADHFEIQRRRSRAVRDYIAEVLLADAPVPIGGRLCALDVDGVVETDSLGFPAPSVQSALALRALMCHSFRPVLVSGRSSGEIAERCVSYRLAGGVGEYGAVVYDALTQHEDCLVSADELAALESVRARIACEDGVTVNRDYRASVRAFRVQNGHTRGLDAALIERALQTSAQGRITAVRGEGQTDFTISRLDKAWGLGSLSRRLKADGGAVALAVGDSVSDLPMLAVAERALAPANADAAVRGAGVEVLSKPYQAGLAQGVARLIGHPPGRCELCRARALPARTKFVLDVLSAREEGEMSMAATLARLTWSVGRL
jgi:3-deoxy-D-manno-octulosonate 8-phosphate phosphatase KdsC-like HAD superfamily phosphatase